MKAHVLKINSFENILCKGEGSVVKWLATRLLDRPLRHKTLQECHTAHNNTVVT
jgi:hypothetical protein